MENLLTLGSVVTDIFERHGIQFDLKGNPLLVVTIVKNDGTLSITTKPETKTTGLVDHLDRASFREDVVYEIEFGQQGHLVGRVDGQVINITNNQGLTNFIEVFAKSAFKLADLLMEVLEALPSVNELHELMTAVVDLRLTDAAANKATAANFAGPTSIKVVCPHTFEDEPDESEIDRGLKGAPEFIKTIAKQAIAERFLGNRTALNQFLSDPDTIVFRATFDCHHVFYNLHVSILTEVSQAILPGIVEERRPVIANLIKQSMATSKAVWRDQPPAEA